MPKDHPFCEEGRVLREHGEAVAVLEAKVGEQYKMSSKLFAYTDDLKMTATENKTLIQGIKEKLENGITDHLEKKIDSLCRMITDQRKELSEHQENVRESHEDLTETMHSQYKVLTERIVKLEEVSWIPTLIDKGSKKTVALIAAAIIGVSALANSAVWAFLKSYYFGEKPGMVQTTSKQVNSFHQHLLPDGKIVIHADHEGGVEPGGVLKQEGNNVK